jgi:hypothetical protein
MGDDHPHDQTPRSGDLPCAINLTIPDSELPPHKLCSR